MDNSVSRSKLSTYFHNAFPFIGISVAAVTPVQMAFAQQSGVNLNLPPIAVEAAEKPKAYATDAQYHTTTASLGPLGKQKIADTPASITTVPGDMLVNLQTSTVNQALAYLPSVEIRDQQGTDVSRPQSRGFMSSVVQNTRLDGLNIIGTVIPPAIKGIDK